MFELPGKVELLGVCYYNASKNNVIPNIVPEDVFYIEIILNGEVYSGDWTEQRICRRGTILWHEKNEETVWRRTSPEQEFTSFALRFRKLEEWKRPARFGQWYNMDNLNEFVIDAMRRSFDPEIDKKILANYLINRLLWEFYLSSATAPDRDLPLPFAKVMALMQNEDMASLKISQIASSIGLSEAHLHNMFRKYLKTTPHKYLLRLRLKRARVLLAGTNHSIKEIGSMCGFKSVESFHRVFRSESGITPANFRKRHTALLNSDIVQTKSEFNTANMKIKE